MYSKENLPSHPVWNFVLSWLLHKAPVKEDGEYSLKGRDILAIVQTVRPLPREQCVFESHQKYIDFHYCISGGELIEYAPAESLDVKTPYSAENDAELYKTPLKDNTSVCRLTAGGFAVFLPGEAHMPKIWDGEHTTIKKVVVKIDAGLLEERS